jgi:hypothetical protein
MTMGLLWWLLGFSMREERHGCWLPELREARLGRCGVCMVVDMLMVGEVQ